jgi:hypothetical protein
LTAFEPPPPNPNTFKDGRWIGSLLELRDDEYEELGWKEKKELFMIHLYSFDK